MLARDLGPPERAWRFVILDEHADEHTLGPTGREDAAAIWLGTDIEAEEEAKRRADLWEDATGGVAVRIWAHVPATTDADHIERAWRFVITDFDSGTDLYLGANGQVDRVCTWLGTQDQAREEARRRSALWEEHSKKKASRVVSMVVLES